MKLLHITIICEKCKLLNVVYDLSKEKKCFCCGEIVYKPSEKGSESDE